MSMLNGFLADLLAITAYVFLPLALPIVLVLLAKVMMPMPRRRTH